MSDKGELDERTAQLIYGTKAEVGHITQEFLRQLSLLLAEKGEVTIPRFGKFKAERTRMNQKTTLRTANTSETRLVEVRERITVHFSKSDTLRDLLRKDLEMDKYGVDENFGAGELEKLAAEGCPECGETLVKHGSVILCPVHGSHPFERPLPENGRENGT